MGQLFDDVFEKSGIYNTLFFNLKSVLTQPNLAVLEQENKPLYDRWLYLERTKYKPQTQSVEETQKVYEQHAPHYPEFSKILAITYAKVYIEDGKLKRNMKKIVNEDEFIVLSTFVDELHRVSSDGAHSTPVFFETLCGHNIVSYDIPLLVKKIIHYRDRFENNKQLPLIIKRSLSIKPWESGVIDTADVWKFNGYDRMPLMLIADYLGLKKTVDLNPLDVVSKNYWELIENGEPEDALEYVSLQSATQTNLVIQLVNELRQL